MRFKNCLLFMMVGVQATIIAPQAYAALSVGDPFSTDSWGQRWYENTAQFDTFAWEVVTTGVAPFEYPGVRNFGSGPAGWSLTYGDTTLAVAHGAPATYLQWDTFFNDPSATPFTLRYVAYAQNGARVISQLMGWTGSGWTVSNDILPANGGWDPGRAYLLSLPGPTLSVPAPGAALLVAVGIGLVGWVKRRLG